MLRFLKCWAEVPDPIPAATDLAGEISARALRFCEPFLVSNAAGAIVNAPIDVELFWTGGEVLAQFADVDEMVLVDRLFLPDCLEHWQNIAPLEASKALPPFLEVFPEHGVVQIWSGLFMSTNPGVSAWVRGPVNRTPGSGYEIVEGVVDTDWWTGPLFSVLRFLKTDFPVQLSRARPLLQVIPVDRSQLKLHRQDISIDLVENGSPNFWNELITTANRRNNQPPGSYRREAVGQRLKI